MKIAITQPVTCFLNYIRAEDIENCVEIAAINKKKNIAEKLGNNFFPLSKKCLIMSFINKSSLKRSYYY